MSKTEPAQSSVYKVPGSMSQIGAVTQITLLDFLRSRRFLVLLTIYVIAGALLSFVVGYYRPAGFLLSPLSFYSSWWGMSATYVVIFTGVFFGGDAIAGEFQNKTGYFTVPNPIRRSSLYVGKWLAAFVASSVVLGVFTVITLANGFYYFGFTIPNLFVESFLFTWLYLVAVLGFTFFFSSLFKSSAYAILVNLILFLFVFVLVQGLVTDFAHIEPWFILTYGSGIIGDVLISPYPVTTTGKAVLPGGGTVTLTTFAPTIPEGLAIITIYFVITAILGLVLFERKEFN